MNISHLQRFCAVFIVVLVLVLSGCDPQPVKEHPSESTSSPQLTILTQKTSTIPPSFVGMNIELRELCTVLQTDAKDTNAYEQLYRNLGDGILHLGGHSIDESSWSPDGEPVCGGQSIITKTEVQAFFAFARRIHWNVIWGLNFLNNDPQMDAAEAAYVASVGGSTLLGFNIGNEPELFVKKGLRPAGWGYNDYIDEWKADRNAVLAQVPSAKFFGPEVCCVSYWFPSFLRDAGENGTLVAGSVHHYISNGGPGNAGGITPQGLLSPQAMNKFKQTEKGWVTEASKEGLPVDITEINTISNGGMAGVSNSFGATLWMSDVLFQSALLGIHQMSFQEVPGASYAFIDTQGYPRIIYLGLLFFSVATAHAALLPSLLNSAENVATYVLKGTNGTLRVVVINKEPKQGIAITMQPGGRYQKMTILRMQAASLTSTSGATLGNTVPSASGAWHPSTQETELIRVGRATLNVPASSAALFTFSI